MIEGDEVARRNMRIVAIALTIALGGCVPPGVLSKRHSMDPNTIAPIYIPTTQYDGYTCDQLAAETRRIDSTISEMSLKLGKGEYDKSGSLVVTPFFLMYDNTTTLDETPKKAQELAQLKGTRMSLTDAASKRKCPSSDR